MKNLGKYPRFYFRQTLGHLNKLPIPGLKWKHLYWCFFIYLLIVFNILYAFLFFIIVKISQLTFHFLRKFGFICNTDIPVIWLFQIVWLFFDRLTKGIPEIMTQHTNYFQSSACHTRHESGKWNTLYGFRYFLSYHLFTKWHIFEISSAMPPVRHGKLLTIDDDGRAVMSWNIQPYNYPASGEFSV